MRGASSIDLVVPTIGRTVELARFLSAVEAQTWRGPTRVIVVDQNVDDRLAPILSSYHHRLSLLHLRSERGVSRACNAGLRHCTADIIARTDDDCWYPPDLLERVTAAFGRHNEWDALSGCSYDESGKTTQIRWDEKPGFVTRENIFRRSSGITVFMRRRFVEAVGEFDESFGPRPRSDGSTDGSSEDSDYVLRGLAAGFVIGYEPAIGIYHADFSPSVFDQRSLRKARAYGIDHSRLLRRHAFPISYAAWRSAQLFVASGIFLALGKPGKARFYGAMATGRVRGIFGPHEHRDRKVTTTPGEP